MKKSLKILQQTDQQQEVQETEERVDVDNVGESVNNELEVQTNQNQTTVESVDEGKMNVDKITQEKEEQVEFIQEIYETFKKSSAILQMGVAKSQKLIIKFLRL